MPGILDTIKAAREGAAAIEKAKAESQELREHLGAAHAELERKEAELAAAVERASSLESDLAKLQKAHDEALVELAAGAQLNERLQGAKESLERTVASFDERVSAKAVDVIASLGIDADKLPRVEGNADEPGTPHANNLTGRARADATIADEIRVAQATASAGE